jgi:hypothetical protein
VVSATSPERSTPPVRRKINNRKYDVRFIPDIRNHWRRDLHNEKGEEPLRNHSKCTAAQAEFEREEFGWEHPHAGLPPDSEECLEEIKHDDGGVAETFRTDADEDSGQRHASPHSDGAKHEKFPTAYIVGGVPRYQATEKIEDLQPTGHDESSVSVQAGGVLEDIWTEERYDVHTRELQEEAR